jgi:cytochrome c553
MPQREEYMKLLCILLPFACLAFSAPGAAQKREPPPQWAFPVTPAGVTPAADDGAVRRVPASSATYTTTQVRDRFVAPVWHAADHPPLPPVVASGRKPDVFACGFCHRADGPGGPENANLAGLPHAYLAQQMRDFRSGARGTSVPGRNTALMIALSKDIQDAEIEAAAAYFAALKPRGNLRVIESEMVPKTYITSHHFALLENVTEKEPLGRRIVEVPDDMEHFASRDSRTRFTVYVPPGAIKAGQELASTGGGGKTIACAVCHGADLKGAGNIPGLAGRFASYTGRQMYDFKSGARNGAESGPMKLIVDKLSNEDILALSAYLASLEP